MWSLVSEIESYLKEMIRESPRGWIEISRKELAGHFECVPSQITYVVNTRFTTKLGYFVESRRGGSGYIRICRLGAPEAETGRQPPGVRAAGAHAEDTGAAMRPGRLDSVVEEFPVILFNLAQRGILTEREIALLLAVFRALESSIPGGEGNSSGSKS